MNFKRIQWIFFFAFLLFDVIIAGSLLVENRFIIANNIGDNSEVIMKEMRNDSITFNKLSSRVHTGFYISGKRSASDGQLDSATSRLRNQDQHFNGYTLSSEFDRSIRVDPQAPEERLNQLIKNSHQVAFGSHYRYNPALSKGQTVVYSQVIEGRPLMNGDGQIKFHMNNSGEVTGYNQTYLEDATVLRPDTPLISQKKAVTWLYKHNQIPNNSRIRWCQLGYSRLMTTNTDNKNVYIPTWTVQMKTKNSGEVEQIAINAFNSTILKNNQQTSINTDSLNR
ncbi:hypothetical protein FD27_GL000591 [Limosilactobacillus frumenti DSM 13145]|uniref:Regulatory protein YycH-like domain-containing protein n=1 Tax=Limosilactobacillus frumenti DSM 13145 TaxID=1423746 RepID=A0A0R1P6S8_9LACO|nr:two-component system regulatory protein YycI [Limosilactobacillus frumenti]KRL27849.1 hypothetical protein FD27_GL000591 [Limosilactobacillus frumenti DSM 13145]MBA2914278.1 hypothetical protein [Limosilactobacillus frumenti]QFG71879.1 hypothetical protein LF145_00105 [Limosilactobacillus frumenti]